jgi:hypothetical protein
LWLSLSSSSYCCDCGGVVVFFSPLAETRENQGYSQE